MSVLSINGKTISCAGPLVYEDGEPYLFYLTQVDFEDLVKDAGGKFSNAINSKTVGIAQRTSA